jgi:hypothetical protein
MTLGDIVRRTNDAAELQKASLVMRAQSYRRRMDTLRQTIKSGQASVDTSMTGFGCCRPHPLAPGFRQPLEPGVSPEDARLVPLTLYGAFGQPLHRCDFGEREAAEEFRSIFVSEGSTFVSSSSAWLITESSRSLMAFSATSQPVEVTSNWPPLTSRSPRCRKVSSARESRTM